VSNSAAPEFARSCAIAEAVSSNLLLAEREAYIKLATLSERWSGRCCGTLP